MLINLDIQIPNASFDLLQVVAKKDQSFYARSQEQLQKKNYILKKDLHSCKRGKPYHCLVWVLIPQSF